MLTINPKNYVGNNLGKISRRFIMELEKKSIDELDGVIWNPDGIDPKEPDNFEL